MGLTLAQNFRIKRKEAYQPVIKSYYISILVKTAALGSKRPMKQNTEPKFKSVYIQKFDT